MKIKKRHPTAQTKLTYEWIGEIGFVGIVDFCKIKLLVMYPAFEIRYSARFSTN